MGSVHAAGLLLTGGASRRLGRDKGALTIPGSGESLARRTGRLLAGVTVPALEVGPGHSGLPAVAEDPLGGGPLVALAAGARQLRARGWTGPVVVVATDLPRLTAGLLAWLAGHPSPRSVVPLRDGVPQSLCARYCPGDLDVAMALVAAGRRALHDLLDSIEALMAGPELWQAAAGDPDTLLDIDTPSDLAHWRERLP
jgi:molybdopterin-guanine dinucleotide biosynthesis protein A